SNSVTSAVTRLMALTYSTNALLDVFFPALFPATKDGKITGTIVGIALTELILGIWATLEKKLSAYKVTDALTRQVTIPYYRDTSRGAVYAGTRQVTETVWSAQFAKWFLEVEGAGGPGDEASGQMVMSDNAYQINSP